MSERLSQLTLQFKINILSLYEVLESLNSKDYDLNQIKKLPDCLATVIKANSISNLQLVKILINQTNYDDIGNKDYSPLKIVGKIDLSMFENRKKRNDCHNVDVPQIDIDNSLLYFKTSPHYDDKKPDFWIEELFLVTSSGEIESIKVSDFIKNKQPLFSAFIGPNGVGKSFLLSFLVDFFLEFYACIKDYAHVAVKYKGKLIGVRYHIDGQSTFLIRTDKLCLAIVDNQLCALRYLRLPLIVACHFGAFDKFHNQSIDGTRQTKYDVPYYKYVGAHVNGNIISSSSIIFRLLFTLSEQMHESQRKHICSVLDFIEYDHTISLDCSFVLKSKKSKNAYEIIKQYVNSNRDYISGK